MPEPSARVAQITDDLGRLASEAHGTPDRLPELERALEDILASRPPRDVREPVIAWMDSTLTAIARDGFAHDDPVHRALHSAFGKLRQQRLRVKDRRRWILGRLCQIIDNLDSWVSEFNGDGLLPGGLDPWMVLVFGSVARGDPAPNDLDLMLLYEDNPA